MLQRVAQKVNGRPYVSRKYHLGGLLELIDSQVVNRTQFFPYNINIEGNGKPLYS